MEALVDACCLCSASLSRFASDDKVLLVLTETDTAVAALPCIREPLAVSSERADSSSGADSNESLALRFVFAFALAFAFAFAFALAFEFR